ncbi:ATP-binding cassette domain-containing protein [Ruminococcaceae bacterium OttesenSCG-928-A16]|nr:ATP-binding cassette domain-containing protein [Ruminococcaceae bacterium OttesenSCG-928-A16]
MLNIINASKTFQPGTPNQHTALDDLCLQLQNGEFVTVIGTNGAGKSTLFNAICGTFFLDKGAITLDETDITFLPEHKRALKIGRVFQDPMKGTAPDMTVRENLAIAYARTHRKALQTALRKQDIELFRTQLATFGMGLEDRMGTKVGLLSGGQRQAVSLLMCTIATPKLLLLDEHTAALDPAAAEKVMEITRQLVAQKKLTTLMITHNINQALQTGTRTIMMSGGKIILDIGEAERKGLTVPALLEMYAGRGASPLDTDRVLFAE